MTAQRPLLLSVPTYTSLLFITIAMCLYAAPGGASLNATPQPQQGTRMECDSNDMRWHSCPADTRGGVELVRQKSESRCIFDRTWGADERGIWVDRGCRAEFEIGVASWRGREEAYTIYCPSDDMNRHLCPVDARFGVRLVRQRSESQCILGRTWGYGPRGVWVDRGCRADFRISGDWGARAATLMYCSSDDMRRRSCPVDTRDGVFIVRQRSESDCIYERTWGFDRDGIWVDRGCRADFEVVDRRDRDWDDFRDWREHDERREDRDHRGDRDNHRNDRRDNRYERRDNDDYRR
jgi:hypothetical protein